MIHRLSVSNAPDRRMVFSNSRESRISVWSCLQLRLDDLSFFPICRTILASYLPTSNAGLLIGLNSVAMVKMPSNLRSGYGVATVHEILTSTLVLPNRTSATPYSSPKSNDIGRYWSNARESSRRFSRSAARTKYCSFVEGSFSRGILKRACQTMLSFHLCGLFVYGRIKDEVWQPNSSNSQDPCKFWN